MLTTQDLSPLAQIFAETRPLVPKRSTKQQRAEYAIWHEIRDKLIQHCIDTNPRFDRWHFITASEINLGENS